MPELPEVEAVRRRIRPAMVRARIVSVEQRRPDLRKPFPRHFAERLTGQTIVALDRRGKYLLASLSSGETLLMHLGMSGWFHIARTRQARAPVPSEAHGPHDHVVFRMSSGKTVVFNDPRRFGVMDLVAKDKLADHPVLSRLGPEPLSDDFDAVTLARACRGKKTTMKAALLDQRVVAGLGNIYASEALHVAGLSPRRRASTVATRPGTPREAAYRLVTAIKSVLKKAITRQLTRSESDASFLVYDRHHEPCPRRGCAGSIRRYIQGGRSTFYCPVCQR